jgi:hypothetical protein
MHPVDNRWSGHVRVANRWSSPDHGHRPLENGGTTTFKFTNEATPAAPCPTGAFALGLSGRVTSSTGAAASIRGHVAATLCLSGNKGVHLAPGTVWTF